MSLVWPEPRFAALCVAVRPWCDLARSLPVATLFAPRVTTTKPIDRHRASYALGSYDLSHRRFDDGNVLFRRSAAYSDAGDHLALAGERHAAAHRGVSAARDGEEGIQAAPGCTRGTRSAVRTPMRADV